jgi:hypothetical protein
MNLVASRRHITSVVLAGQTHEVSHLLGLRAALDSHSTVPKSSTLFNLSQASGNCALSRERDVRGVDCVAAQVPGGLDGECDALEVDLVGVAEAHTG